MTDGVIWKQLVQFSIPLAIGLLFQQLYNTVDAVVVVTPTRFHREIVEAAASLGKHILCEKPMALTREACAHMIAAAEATGKKLMVGQVCIHSAMTGTRLAAPLLALPLGYSPAAVVVWLSLV